MRRAASVLLVLLVAGGRVARGQDTVTVSPTAAIHSVAAGIARAHRHGVVAVMPGVYREPTILVDKPVTILGVGTAVIDGERQRQTMTVTADSVTIRGLTFRDIGASFLEDRAAIKVLQATDCTIENNRVERAFFGIYLARVSRCVIAGNVMIANGTTEAGSGNGIHLWTADHVTIANNTIRGHRDGIYFEFVHESRVAHNLSENNLRYGLHFMFSDDCRYERNTFRHNGAGVAVMYTRDVAMVGNDFTANRGAAAYGLLLKEISDPVLEDNRFVGNTTGLFADGTTRLVVRHNTFADNGWAIRLDANGQSGRIVENDFLRNTFDVATNGRTPDTVLEGNYWDSYTGYDMQHDGHGDVPHRPVRLFALLVQENEPTMILLRSSFVALLDAAERVIPALTPETLADTSPAMRPIHGDPR